MTKGQREKVTEAVIEGKVHFLLVSPEALVGGGGSAGGCLPNLSKFPPVAFACTVYLNGPTILGRHIYVCARFVDIFTNVKIDIIFFLILCFQFEKIHTKIILKNCLMK